MNYKNIAAMCITILFLYVSPLEATIYRVNTVASGTADGQNWADAMTLTQVFNLTNPALAVGDEIWVHSGTYQGTITLVNGVKMYGGFVGTETIASQSDPTVNVTIIDGTDTTRAIESHDHSSSTVLRGFKIINGHNSGWEYGGGGMLCENSSVSVVQCVFENNTATWWGAGVSIHGTGSPSFVNCIFHDNGEKTIASGLIKTLGGGAVFLKGGSPTFTNCLLYSNTAGSGGTVLVKSGTPTFINCTITGNCAYVNQGGAIWDMTGAATIKNSILWNNIVGDCNGGSSVNEEIFNGPTFSTTIINSNVQGGWTGTGNINSDPLFMNAASNDYTLQNTSPCINTGNRFVLPLDVGDLDWDSNVTELLTLDLEMKMRISYFKVEMGAYETPFIPPDPN